MRTWGVATLALLLAAVPGHALAQGTQPVAEAAPGTPVQVLTDPPQDAALTLVGQPGAPPSDSGRETDLVSTTVAEDLPGFTFTTRVDAFRGDESFGSIVQVMFRHGDTAFRVVAFTRGGEQRPAFLAKYDEGRGTYDHVADLTWQADASTATLTVHVPRALLADSSGAAPGPGRLLERFHAE